MTHWKTRLATWTFILLALAALQGCGFHLRGSAQLPPSISPLRIHGLADLDPLRNDLRQVLTEAGLRVTDKQADAGSILQIYKQDRNRRVLSVDERGKVVEYELHYGLEFDLVDGDGTRLVEKQDVGVQRAYVNPQTGILGKEQEEALMNRDMRLDLARRIVERLQEQLSK
ncbi:MAG TPA: hypothetical protein ENI99_01315 [Sedimenticola sp.]|nr:hypothetical protein [Sedimenticola sp.]